MSGIQATAPGKLMWVGEYAVLDGATAVVTAIDRRVSARIGAHEPSPFLVAAATQVAVARGAASKAARAAGSMNVDSRALQFKGAKLGLGSSAASTVAAVSCALAYEDPELGNDKDLVFKLAAAAHADAQAQRGARGSGADVASSTFGGTVRFQRGRVQPITLPALSWLPYIAGPPADTVRLIKAVERARLSKPTVVEPLIVLIADAAEQVASATTVDEVLGALDAAADAVAALGQAAGVDLETEAVRSARKVVTPLGGVAKTCGAGGGDIAIAVLPANADLAAARRALAACGCVPLSLQVDPTGVEVKIEVDKTDFGGAY